MNKLFALLGVFRHGNAVADPALWKNRAGMTMALTALITAIVAAAKAFGYELPIDGDTAALIAGGIAAVVGIWANYATSDKVGLPAKAPAQVDPPAALADAPRAETGLQPVSQTDDPAASDLRGGP
jgi:hypothetical protein